MIAVAITVTIQADLRHKDDVTTDRDPRVGLVTPDVTAVAGVGQLMATWNSAPESATGPTPATLHLEVDDASGRREVTVSAGEGRDVIKISAKRGDRRIRGRFETTTGELGPWSEWRDVAALGSVHPQVDGAYRSATVTWNAPASSNGIPVGGVELAGDLTVGLAKRSGTRTVAGLAYGERVTVRLRLHGPSGLVGPWTTTDSRAWAEPSCATRRIGRDSRGFYGFDVRFDRYQPGAIAYVGDRFLADAFSYRMDSEGSTHGWIYGGGFDDPSNLNGIYCHG